MKFRVTGTSKSTGARMTLEFEAQSKAQAERRASQHGVNVTRAENMSDGESPTPYPTDTGRSVRKGSVGGTLFALLVLAGIIFAIYHFWPQIQAMLPGK